MPAWLDRLRNKGNKPPEKSGNGAGPTPGISHFLIKDGESTTRVHLRIDPGGSGLLLVNAARAYQLNPTGTFMADLALRNVPFRQALDTIRRRYRVSQQQAFDDYINFKLQLNELISPNGACPICDLELETIPPFTTKPPAPYRMDLAITYRCNNACAHCYNARPRNHPELGTEAWLGILDQLWQIGIPHVVFTGGEPTLRKDLPELIARAESNGQITGINTNGRRLKDMEYVQSLVDAGLDHVQITLESHDPAIHNGMVAAERAWQDTVQGIRNVLQTRLYVMTNTTMLVNNAPYLDATLDFLAELGMPTVGLNALIYSGRGKSVGTGLPEERLPPLLELARAKTTANGQRLIWYTPTQYCKFDPVQMELGVKGCTAALYNMCIEPDGSVLPCQSYYRSLGNILTDPWEGIWNHDLSISLRERHNLPKKCGSCALISQCGGGCPLLFAETQPETQSI